MVVPNFDPHPHYYPKVWFDQNFSTSISNKNLFEKSTILKMSRFSLHNNNNAEKLLTNGEKSRTINNKVIYFYWYERRSDTFRTHLVHVNFMHFFLRFWKQIEIFINVGNVTNFEYISVTTFYMTLDNFAGIYANSVTVTASNILRKWYFRSCKNNAIKFKRIH